MSETLGTLEKRANEAGLLATHHDGSLVVTLTLPHGREQTVFIAESGQSPRGERVVSFTSPCHRLRAGFLRGLSRGRALELLRRNAAMPFAAFCLLTLEDEEILCVRTTALLETLDQEEFQAACECVARFADAYEEELGKDDY